MNDHPPPWGRHVQNSAQIDKRSARGTRPRKAKRPGMTPGLPTSQTLRTRARPTTSCKEHTACVVNDQSWLFARATSPASPDDRKNGSFPEGGCSRAMGPAAAVTVMWLPATHDTGGTSGVLALYPVGDSEHATDGLHGPHRGAQRPEPCSYYRIKRHPVERLASPVRGVPNRCGGTRRLNTAEHARFRALVVGGRTRGSTKEPTFWIDPEGLPARACGGALPRLRWYPSREGSLTLLCPKTRSAK